MSIIDHVLEELRLKGDFFEYLEVVFISGYESLIRTGVQKRQGEIRRHGGGRGGARNSRVCPRRHRGSGGCAGKQGDTEAPQHFALWPSAMTHPLKSSQKHLHAR